MKSAYGDGIAAILALAGEDRRLLPLTQSQCLSGEARTRIHAASLQPVVKAGLYLYFDCWNEAHETAQDISTAEGSYWHAIVHRQEPDAGNSGYWFRQVGAHPIFPAVRDAAIKLGVDLGPKWKPEAFIDFCENAREAPGSQLERQAMEVQRAEWQLLFDYCLAKTR